MTVVAMSHGELSRYDTLLRFQRRELRVEDAAMLLGVGRPQVFYLAETRTFLCCPNTKGCRVDGPHRC